MGVDTGRALHVVILKADPNLTGPERLVFLGECHEFSELDELMKRFQIGNCVIDGLPETHVTREFALRHSGSVYMCFFQDNQRGAANWDGRAHHVVINRTEALDSSRGAIREKRVILPRRDRLVEKFAQHMTCDAKVLDEDEETGVKKYRYIKTGENHFSLAFTYAWMASQANTSWKACMQYMQWMSANNGPWI